MKKYYLLLSLFIFHWIVAQNAADLDLDFNTYTTPENQYYAENPILKVLPQSDGKLIVMSQASIARVSDNKFDTTFNIGTGFTFNFSNGLSDFTIAPDGKIVIVGSFTAFNGTTVNKIIRLNTDGSLDASFALNGTGVTSGIEDVQSLPDGKILISGTFGSYNGVYRNSLARLNQDGSLDQSFTSAFDLGNTSGTLVRLQADQKILVVKKSADPNEPFLSLLYRLNSDGSVDDTFTHGDINIGNIRDLTILNDGKIVVVGDFISYNSTANKGIVRINADGSIDKSFIGGEIYSIQDNFYPLCITSQTDGKLIVGGTFTKYNNDPSAGIVRINTDGSIDNTFNIGSGFQYTTNISVVSVMADGKIIGAGNARYYNNFPINYITRINADGSRDATFTNFAKGLDYSFGDTRIAEQVDGKILVSGLFGSYNDATVSRFIRLNVNGSIDPTFALTGTGFSNPSNSYPLYNNNSPVLSIVPQPDGKILVGGTFTKYNGITVNKLVRLNNDGSLDTGFENGSPSTNDINIIRLQPDGKILLMTSSLSIICLNTDGTQDTTFQTISAPASISTFYVQTDGKILVASNHSTMYLKRYNSNGTVDASFQYNSSLGRIIGLSIQLDGKILFITSTASSSIIKRINSNGTLDTSFTYPVAIGSAYQVFSLQNSKVLVYCNTGLKRLYTNGSQDNSYYEDPDNPLVDDFIDEIMLQQDGKVILYGPFNRYRGVFVGKIARLMGEAAEPLAVYDFTFDSFFRLYPNPANNQLNISKKQDIEIRSLAVYNALGQLLITIHDTRNLSAIDISSLKSGNYFLRIDSDKGISNTKFIKL